MSVRRKKTVCAAIALVLGAQALLPAVAAAQEPPKRTRPQVIAELPVGFGRGEVGVESTPEGDWGATAFAIGPDGRFYVVDGVNDKLVVLDAKGELVKETPFPKELVCPEDIIVTAGGIYLMDVAAQPGFVCRMSSGGSIEATWPLPEELNGQAVTGIAVPDAGGEDVFLEVDGTWSMPLVRNGRLAHAKPPVLVRRGNRVDVTAAETAEYGLRGRSGHAYATSLDRVGGHEGVVNIFEGGRRLRSLRVRTAGRLAHLKALASDAAGVNYLTVEEESTDGRNAVSSYVEALDTAGHARARFEVPVHRFATTPNRPLRVDASGRVFCLVPGRNTATIERLAELEVADATTHETASIPTGALSARVSDVWRSIRTALTPSSAHAIWDQIDANDRANDYVYNSWYCSSANYSRSCGDYRPAYITSSNKTYRSVPYCWGGFDKADTFNAAMRGGKDAGDVKTSGSKRSCTAGVDCSGFLSRLWGLTTKRSTYTLSGASYSISRSRMDCADLYLKPGSHAIAHKYFTGNGDSAVWESTTSSDKDRVVSWVRTASYLSNYQTRRNNSW